MFRKYTVIFKDSEENEYAFEVEANSPADASDSCYCENSDEVIGYEEVRIIEGDYVFDDEEER